MSGLSDWIEYAALRALLGFLARIPESFGRWLCRGLGDILYDVIRLRRRVTLENLRASFPEKTEGEIRTIARACYRTFCETVAEFARVPRLSPEQLVKSSTVVGRDHLEEAASSGRGDPAHGSLRELGMGLGLCFPRWDIRSQWSSGSSTTGGSAS